MKAQSPIPKSTFQKGFWFVLLLFTAFQTTKAQQFTIDVTLADQGQQNTIAFDGLAFLTGTLGSDSFFPPGKVADFWGFQYLRDNDPSGMGHNTSFLTGAANNMLNVLTAEQRQQLVTLAKLQVEPINEYGYKRFVLMKAFRRLLAGDFPAETNSLDREAVKGYSAQLYRLDGGMSFQRARIMGSILYSLTETQKAYLDAMSGKGMLTWPVVDEPIDLRGLGQDVKVAVMTYAGDMFSWYAGSVDADVYFCPERQGTYFGSFYMKDAPAIGNPDYTISSDITADYGNKFLQALTANESALISGLVDIQRPWLYEIVERRKDISVELRKFMAGGIPDSTQVISLMTRYGELDGEIIYNFASNFATVNGTNTPSEKDALLALRKEVLGDFNPTGAYLYATPIAIPSIPNTDFLFTATFGISVTASANNVCEGTNVTYTATPVNGGTSPAYIWKVNDVNAGSGSNTFIYSPANNDVITCELIPNTNIPVNSQIISAPITMTVNSKLPVSVSVTPAMNSVCSGTNVIFNATPVNGGNAPQYQWKINGNVTGPNSATFNFNPANNDIISCILTSNLSCISGSPATSNKVAMTVNTAPAQPGIINGVNAICSGTAGITYNVVPVTGASGYIWNVPAGSVVTSGQGTNSIAVNFGSTSGILSVAAANTCGTSPLRTLNMAVNPAVPAQITTSTATTFCSGGSITLSANTGSGYLYQWKSGTINISGATKSTYITKTGGSFSVAISKTGYCAGTSAPVNVTVVPLPPPIITVQGALSFCQGGSVQLTANTELPLTYQWKKDGVSISGAVSSVFKATVSGTYTVSETNSNGCSSTSQGIKVTVNPIPAVTVTPVGPISLSTGGSTILTATKVIGCTYQWFKNNILITGASTYKYTASVAGVYNVVVFNSTSGCTTTSNYITVNTPLKSVSLQEDPFYEPTIKNFPNPFNEITQFDYSLSEPCMVSLKIYNLSGTEVASLVNSYQENGIYTITFGNQELASGTYIYRFIAKGRTINFAKSKKLIRYKN